MGLRDRAPQFEDLDADILGISFDTPEENRYFAEKNDFPFRLLSDVDHAVGTQYGAKRPPDDPRTDYPSRLTFLIDPEGVVARTYEVTDVQTHPEEVLADLRELTTA